VAFFTIIGDYSYAMETMNKSYFGVALLAIYAFTSQIILVNLLIAMMGNTYEEVKGHSDKEWQYNRYIILYECKAISPVPPPFNGMVALFNFLSKKIRVCQGYQLISSPQEKLIALSETDKNILKKLKISREKIREKDKDNENASLKNLWSIAKEQLRLMSSLHDSDRKYYEQQIEASEERYEKELKTLEQHHEMQLKTLEQQLKTLEKQLEASGKKHEQQLEASEKKHEQRFAEMLGVLNKIEQQLPKNFNTKAEKEE